MLRLLAKRFEMIKLGGAQFQCTACAYIWVAAGATAVVVLPCKVCHVICADAGGSGAASVDAAQLRNET